MQPAFDPKDYPLIGKLLARHNPGLAADLVTEYRSARDNAIDGNLRNLNYYYLVFCKIHGLNPDHYLGALYLTEKIDMRRLFIGTMVYIYAPELLQYDLGTRTGLQDGLCLVLRYDPGNMKRTIDEAVEWMKSDIYEFKDKVEQTAAQLIHTKEAALAVSQAA